MRNRRPTQEIDTGRSALSLRGLERAYGYSRLFTSDLVKTGALPATPRGRAVIVLRRDFEDWMRRNAVRPTAHAERRVAEILERDRARVPAA